jgi:hypothetical protein
MVPAVDIGSTDEAKKFNRRNRIYEDKHKQKRNEKMSLFRSAVDEIVGPAAPGQRRRGELEYIDIARSKLLWAAINRNVVFY